MEGYLRFKIDWASLIVGSKFTVFALFYFVFEGNFPSTSPQGGLYLEGLIHGGAYFRNFMVQHKIVNAQLFTARICSKRNAIDPYNNQHKAQNRQTHLQKRYKSFSWPHRTR